MKTTRELSCWCCNAAAKEMHHLVPKRAGGADVVENLLPLCRFCHNLIDRQSLDAFPIKEGIEACDELLQTQWGRLLMLKWMSVAFDAETMSSASKDLAGHLAADMVEDAQKDGPRLYSRRRLQEVAA